MPGFDEEIFDEVRTREFDRRYVATRWAQYKLDRIAELLFRLLNIDTGKTILEVGCGTGDLALRLANSKHSRVTCLDISKPMLNIASARRNSYGRDIDFVMGDALHLPFKSGSFDIVFERNISPLLFERCWNDGTVQKLLQEMKRVSKERVIVMHQNKNVLTQKYVYKRYSCRELTGRLEKVGLHNIECAYVTYSTPFLLKLFGEKGMKTQERMISALPVIKTLSGAIIGIGHV